MTNWSEPSPYEPTKPHYLHDQERIPAPPKPSVTEYGKRFSILLVGFFFTVLLVGLAFQTRDSWGAHRDWVVPMTVPLLGLAGIALAYLLVRRAWLEATPGIVLVMIAVLLGAANLWRGAVVDGPDTLRDVLAISGGVFLSLGVLVLIGAMAWVELRRPTRPPEVQM
jgi:hypothetical protein